jgi:hypothetical protein
MKRAKTQMHFMIHAKPLLHTANATSILAATSAWPLLPVFASILVGATSILYW